MKRKRRNNRKKASGCNSGVSSSLNVDLMSPTTDELKGFQFNTHEEFLNYIKSDVKLNSVPYINLIDVFPNKQSFICNRTENNEKTISDENEETGNVEKKSHLSNEEFISPNVYIEDQSDKSCLESFVSRLSSGIITLNSLCVEDDKMKKIEIWNRKVNYNLIEITSDCDIFKDSASGNNLINSSSPCNYKITENYIEVLRECESPKSPKCIMTPLKRKPVSPKSNSCDNSNIKKICDIVFKVPSITKPNITNRDINNFKKPAVNIIQSSSVNQHLRSRIEAFRTMKCLSNETITSNMKSKDDDLLSIFAASDFNEEVPKKTEEIESFTENNIDQQSHDIIKESSPTFSIKKSKSISITSDPPNSSSSLKDSLLNSSSFSPTMFDTELMEKSGDIIESDYESNNEEIVTNWLSESNKINPMSLMKKFCWYYKKCKRSSCTYFHALPKELENALIHSSNTEINNCLQWILKVKSISLIEDAFPLFVKAFYMQQNDEALIDLIQDILNIQIDKTPHVKSIIKALASLEGYDFSKAISEIILTHGRKNSALTDILLNVIVDEENFLIHYWNLITNVTKCKHVFIDFGIVDDIIRACLKINHKDVYIKVCKDLLMKPIVKIDKIEENLVKNLITRLNQLSLPHYSQFIINIINNSSSTNLHMPNNYGETSTNTPIQSAVMHNTITESISKDVSDTDIIALNRAILSKNAKSFVYIVKRNSHNFLSNSFITHIILLSRKLNNIMHLHELLMISIKDTSYLMGINAQFANFWHHIGFNLLPLYDLKHQYTLAAEIITRFPIKALLHCQCLYDEEPYRSNLKNIEEKMVFIIKLLTRANFLSDAFNLISMEEFHLNDNSNIALYEYKIKNVTDFLTKLLDGNQEFCSKTLHVFIYGQISIPAQLNIWPIYNKYLLNILNLETRSLVLHEIPVIQLCYQYICTPILRGFFVYLYKNTDYSDIVSMYKFFCEKSIYLGQNINGSIIAIKSNYTIDEIFIVIRSFLLNMLHCNKTPIPLKISVLETNENIDELIIPKILKENLSYEAKLLFAAAKFVPPLVLNNNIINSNSVKLCLEQFRRHNYNSGMFR